MQGRPTWPSQSQGLDNFTSSPSLLLICSAIFVSCSFSWRNFSFAMLSNSFVKCFATYNATKRKHFKNRLPESHDSFSLSSHEAVGLVECLHRCKTPKWTAANLAYFRQKNYKTITIQHQWNTENCDGDACHQTKNPTCHQHLWNYDHIQLWLRLWLSSTSSVWTDNISRTATRNDTTRYD